MERLAFSHLQVEVTRRCNFNCEHCLRGDAIKEDLPFVAIDNLLDHPFLATMGLLVRQFQEGR